MARNELVADTTEGLQAVLMQLLSAHRRGEVRISRIKDRLSRATPSGWADLSMNLVIPDDPRLHIFELQLVHLKMSLMRAEIGGHADYEIMRAASEIWNMACHRDSRLRSQISEISGRCVGSFARSSTDAMLETQMWLPQMARSHEETEACWEVLLPRRCEDLSL